MSYVLTLDELSSKKLEELAEKERLPASELIERAVMWYLGSIGEGRDPPGEADPKLDSEVASRKDLYGWDEQKGTVRFLPSNRRAFIMNAHAWDAVEESLFLVLEKDAARILSVMGHAFGRMIASDYRSVTDEPENIKSYFEYLSLAAGWGKFSVSGDLQNGSKITIRVMNCVFCTSRNASIGRKNPCCFLMGVCKGTADTVFDFSHDVHETKCCAKGNDSCEIVLSRELHSETGTADWSWSEHPSPITAWS
jgi:predicted hydrocarbon binding protein